MAGTQVAARFAALARHGDGHVLDQKRYAGERRRMVQGGKIGRPQLDHGIDLRVDGGAGAQGGIVQFGGRDAAFAQQLGQSQTIKACIFMQLHQLAPVKDEE